MPLCPVTLIVFESNSLCCLDDTMATGKVGVVTGNASGSGNVVVGVTWFLFSLPYTFLQWSQYVPINL